MQFVEVIRINVGERVVGEREKVKHSGAVQ